MANGTQKEHSQIARMAFEELKEHFPNVMSVLENGS
jgi:hypothetical protein